MKEAFDSMVHRAYVYGRKWMVVKVCKSFLDIPLLRPWPNKQMLFDKHLKLLAKQYLPSGNFTKSYSTGSSRWERTAVETRV